jgi:hypothetical protein
MKLHQNTREIERGGIRVEREATIVADAVAFKVLSDMLYPDKPLAIIRELMCNAYDSHTAAGKPDAPVHLHLPNTLEPYLSIRDFGLGLSFRDACILMLTYFKSTKRDSNEVTGALGLGSKTPFSYVDSYTVTTWYNGRKFVFNAFINERGNPSMALLSRERTTEPNGVEIMMPVRRSDYYLFVERAQTVLEWFRVKPVVTGARDFKINSRDYEMEGTNWKIARAEYHRYYYRHDQKPYAIQGNIAYPIDVNSMPDLPLGYADLLRQSLFLTFPIGSISFTAGRDAISYDKGTVANIIAALDTVVKEVPEKWQVKFDDCKTMWEARCVYASLIGDNNSGEILRILNNHQRLKFKWNGADVGSTTATISMKDFTDPVVTALLGGSSKSKRHIGKDDVNITAAKATKFYIDDLPKGAITRLRSYRFQNQPDHDLILLSADTTDVAAKRKIIDEMLEQLGNPEFILASTLPTKKRSTNTMGHRSGRIVEVDDVLHGRHRFKENTEEIDMDEGGFYIPIFRGNAQFTNNGGPISRFYNILDRAHTMNILAKSDTIIGVNPSQMSKFEGKDGWVNVIEHVREKFLEQAKADQVMNELASDREFQNIRYGGAYRMMMCWTSGKADKALGADHVVTKFMKAYRKREHVTRKSSTDDMTIMAQYLGVNWDQSGGVPEYEFGKEWAKIMADYPMLELINYPDVSHATRFLDYMQDIDLARSIKAAKLAPAATQSKVVKLEVAN